MFITEELIPSVGSNSVHDSTLSQDTRTRPSKPNLTLQGLGLTMQSALG